MNRRPIYLLGMGGFGPELVQLLRFAYGMEEWEYAGFFDDHAPMNSDQTGTYRGTIEQARELPEGTGLVVGTFLPQAKQSILSQLRGDLERFVFPNIIHQTVQNPTDGVQWGQGNIVQGGCWFTTDIRMGDFNSFNHQVSVGHGARIGSFNAFMPKVSLAGDVHLGDSNLLALGSSVLATRQLGNHQHLGPHACLMSQATAFAPGTLWLGNPALPHQPEALSQSHDHAALRMD